ncbi:MAG: Ig-like domain-containing protein [Rhizobiaceae bacterium]
MMALEPRIVLDAAFTETVAEISSLSVHSLLADNHLNQVYQTNDGQGDEGLSALFSSNPTAPVESQSSRSEIIFISEDVEDLEPFLSGLADNVEVIILDNSANGFAQISSALANRSQLDAVHLITHGDEGIIQFGQQSFDAQTLANDYQDELAQIGTALAVDGDLLIYGCDFGAGTKGQEAVNLLSQLTGADVAGSDDPTGHLSLGGDWELETTSGEIETAALDADDWIGTLADPVIVSDGGGYSTYVYMDENQTYATTVQATDDDLPSDTLTYAIFGGFDAGDFTIDSNTGVLNFVNPPDYENPTDNIFTNGIYTVGVAVIDSSGNYDTQYVSVVVRDVNDAPEATGGAVSTDEDNAVVIGPSAFIYSDDDGDSLQSVTLSNFHLAGGSLTRDGGAIPIVEGMTLSVAELADLTYTPLANSTANASFDYVANDALNGTVSASMVITVNAVDDPPSVTGPAIVTSEDVAYDGSVLMTDVDAGDSPEASLGSAPSNGVVTVNTDGTYSYTPNTNFSGADSFSIIATDDSGLTDSVTINVTVTPVNDAPIITHDPATIMEDAVLIGALTVADVDIGDTPEATLDTPPENGIVVVNADGTYSYTPNTHYFGADSFSVVVTDDAGLTDSMTVNITVAAVNDAPDAFTDSVNIPEDVATALSPTIPIDVDDDAADMTVTLNQVPTPTQGTIYYIKDSGGSAAATAGKILSLSEFATLSFTPVPSYAGTVDQLQYTVSDDEGLSDSGSNGTITLIINGINDAPTASTQAIAVTEDITTALNPTLPADIDDALADLTISVSQVPSTAQGELTYDLDLGGTATVVVGTEMSVTEFGTLSFNPATNYQGAVDAFTYRVTDDDGSSNADSVGAINLSIIPQNDLPGANTPDIIIAEDQVHSGAVLMTDPDQGDTPEASLASAPANGTAVINADGTYTYTPDANFSGADIFSIRITDDAGANVTVSINVTVTQMNDAPVLSASNPTTTEDVAVVASVVMSDPDTGDAPVASLGSAPTNGFVTVNADGTYTYTPLANFSGTDSFTIIATDGSGATDTKSISVTVTPVNDAPIALDATHTLPEDGVLNATLSISDVDVGDTPQASLSAPPSNGAATVNADGSYSYVPNSGFSGFDSFTILVTDDAGLTDTATIIVNIAFGNDAPTISATPINTEMGTPFNGSVVVTDPDPGDIPVVTLGSGPANGSVVVNADGTYTYTPNSGFFGSDSFELIATDNLGLTANTSVEVTVVGEAASASAYAYSSAAVAASSATSASEDAASGAEEFETMELGVTEATTVEEPASKQASLLPPEQSSPTPFKLAGRETAAGNQPSAEQSQNVLSVKVDEEIENIDIATKTRLPGEALKSEFKYQTLFEPMNTAATIQAVDDTVKDLRRESEFLGVAIDKVTYAFGSILSVGGVSFVLRGGVLAAAMMTTLPAWARFDPISVVSNTQNDQDEEPEEVHEAERMKEFILSARSMVGNGVAK